MEDILLVFSLQWTTYQIQFHGQFAIHSLTWEHSKMERTYRYTLCSSSLPPFFPLLPFYRYYVIKLKIKRLAGQLEHNESRGKTFCFRAGGLAKNAISWYDERLTHVAWLWQDSPSLQEMLDVFKVHALKVHKFYGQIFISEGHVVRWWPYGAHSYLWPTLYTYHMSNFSSFIHSLQSCAAFL